MSTQPVPTFPLMAGFEKYAGMTCVEIAEEYLKNNPDILGIKEEEVKRSSPEILIDMYSSILPRLRDLFADIEKYSTDKNIPFAKREAAELFRYNVYKKKLKDLQDPLDN